MAVTSQAFHDDLTGLPNRQLFADRLGNALARARRIQSRVAVMFVDLDHFKQVNDRLGHRMADSLLKVVVHRLEGAVREQDTIARVGGDEFVLLFQDLRTDDAHVHIAENLLARVAEPGDLGGNPIQMTASLGVSLFPNDGEDPETLIVKADAAMYRAKESGRNNFQVFAPAMTAKAAFEVSVEYQLREAVKNGDFLLHYQPVLDLASDRVVGAEALVRWSHAQKGLIEPKYFIPLAEESTLILPICSWVFRTACRQGALWQNESDPGMGISVNVSAMQFRKGDLLETVRRGLDESGLKPETLTLEITEGVAIHDEVNATRILRAARDLGIRVALDDFGTGYSSLAYLRRLPITHIKIDQSFLKGSLEDPRDREIVGSMIRLAHSLGLQVVAEGVETNEQKAQLKGLGCDECQGYLVSHPLPAAEFSTFLGSYA